MAFLLRRLHDNDGHCFSKISASGNKMSFADDLYAPFPEMKHKVVGYCKGLFCLEYEDGKILLWNPSTDAFKQLPPSDMELRPCIYPNCATSCKAHVLSRIRGLGFDPKSGDYKVVRFITVFYVNTTDNTKEFDHGSSKQAEVYSLKNDGWKEIFPIVNTFEKYDITDEYGFYINGFCCWRGARKNYHKRAVIVLLDLADDSFSILCLPKVEAITNSDFDSILIEFKGSLGIVVYTTLDICKALRPWVWEYGQWIETGFNVGVEAERPLGYCRNDELLLLEGFDRKLMVYDSVTQELKKIDEIYDHPHTMQLFPYVEAMVSLDTNTSHELTTCTSPTPCHLKIKKENENIKKEVLEWITWEKRRKWMVLRRKRGPVKTITLIE